MELLFVVHFLSSLKKRDDENKRENQLQFNCVSFIKGYMTEVLLPQLHAIRNIHKQLFLHITIVWHHQGSRY